MSVTSGTMGGVLRFSSGGVPVQAPIYQAALEVTENVLWATSYGGLLYKIDAASMVLISSLQLNATAIGAPSNLIVDDSNNRVYVIYIGGADLYPFIVDSAANLQLKACAGFTPGATPSTYQLSLTQAFYDQTTRRIGVLAYLPITGTSAGYRDFYVTGDVCGSSRSIDFISVIVASVVQMLYPAPDIVFLITVFQGTNSITQQTLYFNLAGVLDGSSRSLSGGGQIDNGPPLNSTSAADFSGSLAAGNQYYLSTQLASTASYLYAVYYSHIVPSGGSLVVQYTPFSLPLPADIVPKTMVSFPNDPRARFIAVDETKGVIFVSTNAGTMKKYTYTEPGNGNAMNITALNYNTDTVIDASVLPTVDSHVFSASTKAIYLGSSVDQGIWRVPFYSCGSYASCESCTSSGDPYCGWCPLTGSCTETSSCSTSKLSL